MFWGGRYLFASRNMGGCESGLVQPVTPNVPKRISPDLLELSIGGLIFGIIRPLPYNNKKKMVWTILFGSLYRVHV